MRRVQITQLDPVARDSLQGAPTNGATVFAMRHGNKKAKLNLPADQRKALIRGLVTQVLRHGKIQTTKARAKAIRKHVDHIITLAKNGSLHARRQALGFVYDPELVKSVFEQAASRYGVSSPSLALDAGVVAGVSAARWCLMALVSGFKASSNASNAQALSACSPLDVVWVGAIPGAAEEWCFRGGLLPAISPDWRGAAVTAIVFGLLHLLDRRRTPVSAAWATGVGAAYGALYLHTGNVADAALAHALSNVVSGLGYKLGGTQAPDTPS
ncbi:hypothetical protein APUTEX25_003861 [Auxenochlorella protothecoides]|uniref:CAAX prenyl protease 2/Lysostaphin resistance protein A-like domain-containing protein n=1 Tax=Auxenochlorella protothecoides TaxID=3075 RepID=A0A3M7L1M2_AUXPR|nr:hypothetical protein APUTEX25_003861 [Auxenochlorella protothecoides]|eukprot:RMZ55895.1 hypothetical protein APUTEX25_003861 [Auxenochlorella protothecoides]